MAILKIRDENGEVQEILAIKGEKGESGGGKELDNNCVVFNDYENNQVLAHYSAGFGTNNTAGYMGFPITDLTLSDDKKSAVVTLFDCELVDTAYAKYDVGDVVQLDLASHWYNVFKITAKSQDADGNTILVIEQVNGGEITRNLSLGNDETDNWLWVVEKSYGLPITHQMAVAVFGKDNISAGNGTAVMGKDNIAVGNYSAVVGRKNVAGYCAFACGRETDAMGQYALAAGYKTKADGIYACALGEKTTASGIRSLALGSNCKATGENSFVGGNHSNAKHINAFVHGNCLTSQANYQTLFGKYAKVSEDMLLAIGNGTATDYASAFSVYDDGHAEVMTQGTTSNSVATKQYVDELIEKLKQAIIELGGNV